MKPEHLLIALFFLGAGILVEFGCVKGGPLLPYDLPLPTPTPVSGAIEAGVIDNGLPVAGVTVLALDPNGDPYMAITDTFGKVGYDPSPLLTGTWTLQVPTQGRYYLSTQPLTVTGGGGYSATFMAGGQTIQVTPTTAETYGSSNTPIGYVITYDQPYNLSVPVSLSTSTDLPGSWGKNFQPVVLGAGVNSSNVTITKTGCYTSSFLFLFKALDFSSTLIHSSPATIVRGFPIPVLLNAAVTLSPDNPCYYSTTTVVPSLTTTGDCNIGYPLRVIGTQSIGSPTTVLNQVTTITNGIPVSFSFYGRHPVTITLSLTTPTTVFSGSITASYSVCNGAATTATFISNNY